MTSDFKNISLSHYFLISFLWNNSKNIIVNALLNSKISKSTYFLVLLVYHHSFHSINEITVCLPTGKWWKQKKSSLRTVQCLLFFIHSTHQGWQLIALLPNLHMNVKTGRLDFHCLVRNKHMKMERVGNSILFFHRNIHRILKKNSV